MNASPVDFARVNAAALSGLAGLVSRWLPGGRINGPEFVCGSLEGEQGRSLSVNLNTGVWKDFAGDASGNDPVSLYAAIHGLKQGEAARRLARELGVDPGRNGAVPRVQAQAKPRQKDDWRPILPVPEDAPTPDFTHSRHGQAVAHWTYRDAQGLLLGHVCRYEPAGERKQILPLAYCQNAAGGRAWRFKAFPEPRPLYRLDTLTTAKPDAPVLLVEGEKTADAAARLLPGVVCLTWPGGSKAVGKADLAPLRGRRVAIWPDADKPGHDAAQALALRLKESVTAEVSTVAPPEGVAEGWDLADAEAEGWDAGRVKAHIQAHREGQETTPKRAFRFLPVSELLAAPRPTRWLIRDYLEAESLSVLFGESGAMKSFVAIDQGLCIASGTAWHGYAIPNPGAVFYLAGEGFHGLLKRIRAWIVAHGKDKAAIPFFVSNAPAQLLDADGVADVAAAITALVEEHGPPRLVVVDTLNRNFGSGDENNSQDMTAFVAALDALKARFGCALTVVHHSGVADKNRSRGSSVLRAALDFEYRLAARGELRVLSCTKSKDHEPPQEMAFEPEEVGTGWTDPETLQEITSCILRQADMPADDELTGLSRAKRIALDALRDACEAAGGPVPVEEWRRHAYESGISTGEAPAKKKAFGRAYRELEEAGLVRSENDLWAPSLGGQRGHWGDMSPVSRGHKGGQRGHTPLGVSPCPPACPPVEGDRENPFVSNEVPFTRRESEGVKNG